MNLCFIIGKIISNINFDFCINSENISITYFNIIINKDTVIKVIGYNEIADYCYSNLKLGEQIFIKGKLRNDCILIEEIIKINNKIN